MAGSHCQCIVNYVRSCQTVFQSGYAIYIPASRGQGSGGSKGFSKLRRLRVCRQAGVGSDPLAPWLTSPVTLGQARKLLRASVYSSYLLPGVGDSSPTLLLWVPGWAWNNLRTGAVPLHTRTDSHGGTLDAVLPLHPSVALQRRLLPDPWGWGWRLELHLHSVKVTPLSLVVVAGRMPP